MPTIEQICDKYDKVLTSCRTPDHFRVAIRYGQLAEINILDQLAGRSVSETLCRIVLQTRPRAEP